MQYFRHYSQQRSSTNTNTLLSKVNSYKRSETAMSIMSVTDCPTYANITSNITSYGGQVPAGTTFQCTADGYLTNTYSWNESVSGRTGSGNVFTLPAGGGPFTLTCTATGNLSDSTSCNATSSNITGYGIGELLMNICICFITLTFVLHMVFFTNVRCKWGGEKNTPKFNKEYLWNHKTDLDHVKTIRRKISSRFLQFKKRFEKFINSCVFFLNTQKYNFN